MTETTQLLAHLANYIDDANALCDRGAFVDLHGLDDRVEGICSAIHALPISEAQQHAAQLDSMMQALETLQQRFAAKRAALGEELGDTGKHHRAAKAYIQSDFSTPKES